MFFIKTIVTVKIIAYSTPKRQAYICLSFKLTTIKQDILYIEFLQYIFPLSIATLFSLI